MCFVAAIESNMLMRLFTRVGADISYVRIKQRIDKPRNRILMPSVCRSFVAC